MGSSKMLMMFVLLLLILEFGWWSEAEGCLERERSALFQLKRFFISSGILRGWVEGDCCRWERVECNTTTGRVLSLDLSYGSEIWKLGEYWHLNASLFTPFRQLENLYLSGNNIAGFVDNEGLERLSKLSNLKALYLDDNFFNNTVLSSLVGLSSLTTLSLKGNKLEGSIDVQELGFLSNLETLYMSDNEIENLVIPKGLSKLDYLELSGNKLNHNILSSLTRLSSSLRQLDLRDNGFKGTFDIQELETLSNLQELDLSYNEIDDLLVPKDYRGLRKLKVLYLDGVAIRDGSKVLQSMGSFPCLKTLYLGVNNFSETVTTQELHNFTNLEDLTLHQSSYHISLLQSIAAFTSLKRLSMSNCKLDGVLHDHQGVCDRLETLEELFISGNDLRGTFPCLANMTSLRVLDISFNQFTGNISSSPLMHLTSIEELTLSNNQFQMPISLEPFFNHSKLKIFRGGSNEIYAGTDSHSLAPKFQLNTIELSGYGNGGSVPKFLYHQHDLREVDLSHINLRGEFPNWLLENNTNLESLQLHNNSLSGSFWMPIHSHRQLNVLDISKNNFQGNIPAEIGTYLPSLDSLNISMNAFNNSIPSSFGDMKNLHLLDLSNNQLTGGIPKHLAMGCFNLEYLVLSNNSLQGNLFSINFNLTNLQRLQLDGNHFNGEIPASLSNSPFLIGLYLSDNNISGKIPNWLGNLSLLEDIILPNNHLEGPIPIEFCQLKSLQILDLSENNISGSLPSCFGLLSIQQVHMSKNMLQGPLKDGVFYNSSSLVTLDLSHNCLNGSIPDWIYRLTQLSYLILANNNLEGEVPIQLCQLKQLRLMDLSHNNLSGQIPHCLDNTSLHEGYVDASAATYSLSNSNLYVIGPPFGYSMGKEETIAFTTKEISYFFKGKPLNNMYGIDLSCNKLTGEIPPQIGELNRIHALNLSHNNLTGSIPSRISNLKQVESLDLSYNKLNGIIPRQLVELNALEVFSVAHNNLSGNTPEWIAQFATFKASSYEGNPFVCGLPLLKSCNENGTQPTSPDVSTNNGQDDSLIDIDSFYITFTISYVIVILGTIGFLHVNPYWRRRWFYLVELWVSSSYYFIVNNLIPTKFYH